MAGDCWAFRRARMQVSPSKMELMVLVELNNLGLYPEFNFPIRLTEDEGTIPDFWFERYNPHLKLDAFYLDHVATHKGKRIDRDLELRALLTEMKGAKVHSIRYSGGASWCVARLIALQIKREVLGL